MAMRSSPQTCGPQDSLTEVAARMAAAKIGCLPVTELGRVVGLITVTDVLEAEVRTALSGTGAGPTVGDAMTPDPVVVHPDDHLLDAASRLRTHGIRHLPVVDGAGNMLGMLSERDVRAAIGALISDHAGTQDPKLELLRVEDAMSRPGISVSRNELCSEVAGYFARLSVDAVAVTDEAGRVEGILSYVDLLRIGAR
jgi:CBS domain-containing protein